MYSVNFTVTRKKLCLSLHYNGVSSYLFVDGKEIVKFKAKESKIIATPLCLENISKDWSIDNLKNTGLNGYVYEFCVHYGRLNLLQFTKTTPIVHSNFKVKYNIE